MYADAETAVLRLLFARRLWAVRCSQSLCRKGTWLELMRFNKKGHALSCEFASRSQARCLIRRQIRPGCMHPESSWKGKGSSPLLALETPEGKRCQA